MAATMDGFGGASSSFLGSTANTSYPARARSPPFYNDSNYQPSNNTGSSIGRSSTTGSQIRSNSGSTSNSVAMNLNGNSTLVATANGPMMSNAAIASASAISDLKKRNLEGKGHRKRSSSLVMVEKIEQSHEELLDQSAGYNYNADWVNYKGAWVIHVVLIVAGKILLDAVPSMGQDTSWTIVNLSYMALSYLMFHYVTGVPFESNAGVYDELTLWEQIDEGAQYTPAKKWLTSVPIGLFLISTHYTRYNPWLFSLNFCSLLFVLFPKLPILHRLRFKIMMPFTPAHSMPPTPVPSRPSSAAGFR